MNAAPDPEDAQYPSVFQQSRLARDVGRWVESFYYQRNLNFTIYNDWFFKQHNSSVASPFRDPGSDSTTEGVGAAPETDRDASSPINIPTYMVNMAVSMVTQETPRIDVLVDESKVQERRRGNKAEKVFNGVIYVNSHLQQRDLYEDVAHNLFLYGWGITNTIWDETRVPEGMKTDIRKALERAAREAGSPDAKRFPSALADDDERAMPLVVEVPHPWDVYPVPGGKWGRWKSVFRKWHMTLEEAEDYFGISFERTTEVTDPERDVEDRTEIDCYDYWVWVGNSVWHAVFTPNLPEFARERDQKTGHLPLAHRQRFAWVYTPEEMPEYDQLPYEIGFCYPTTDPRGEYFGLSLLYTVLDSVREAEALVARMNLIVDQFADPLIKRTYDTLKNRQAQPAPMVRGPGMTVDVNEGMGQDVEYVQLQGVPPGVMEMLDRWLQFAREHGFDPTIDGTTGLDTIVKKSGILTKLVLPVRELERLWAGTHGRVVRLLTRFTPDHPLKVRGVYTMNGADHAFALDVKGSDMKGMQYAKVTIRVRFPYEELQNAAAARTAVDGNLISLHRAQGRFMMVDDPDQELQTIQDERIELSPKWGEDLITIALTKLQALAQPPPALPAAPMMAPPTPASGPALPPPPGPEGAAMGPMMPGLDMLDSLQQGGMDMASYQDMNPQQAADPMAMLSQQTPGRPLGS